MECSSAVSGVPGQRRFDNATPLHGRKAVYVSQVLCERFPQNAEQLVVDFSPELTRKSFQAPVYMIKKCSKRDRFRS
jgi:hypothetical protein